jgi:hypothetical protein
MLALIGVICVPIMLFVKPFLKKSEDKMALKKRHTVLVEERE